MRTNRPFEAAIEKIEAFKTAFHETLTGITEFTTLLKQAVRDQKDGEKEVQQDRRIPHSLKGVRS